MGRPGALAGQIFRRHSRYGRVALSNLTASVLDNAPLEQPGKSASDDRAPKPRERRVFTQREREGVVLIRPPPAGGKGSLNFSKAFFRRPPPKIPLGRQRNQLHQKTFKYDLKTCYAALYNFLFGLQHTNPRGLGPRWSHAAKKFSRSALERLVRQSMHDCSALHGPEDAALHKGHKFQFKLLTISFL